MRSRCRTTALAEEDPGLVERRGLQCHFERGGDVLGLHRGAQLPGDDVAGEVVKKGGGGSAISL